MEREQTQRFEAQSLRYVEKDLRPVAGETSFILGNPWLTSTPPERVLDVGCGPGYVLTSILDAFPGSTGVGVEPSAESVALLRARSLDDLRLEFVEASAHHLPFETDSFDLVTCWSVLHWIGRNEYLQALGELVRVTRQILLVMDFAGGHDYRVPYRYDEGLFTYKTEFADPILASGLMILRDDARWVVDDEGERQEISADDLEPFLGNPLNFHARRACLFEKDYGLLPTHTEDDFS